MQSTDRRLTRRLVQLFACLVLYGISIALLVRSGLGVMPWDVLHQGLALRTEWSIGTMIIITGAVVLLCWVPLRQRPGFGTIANAIVVGIALDFSLLVMDRVFEDYALPVRIAMVPAGIVLNAFATAGYIGARLGPGPRDGLMTGLVERTGGSVRLVRTGIEVLVVAGGWLLGGTVGVGTVLYAVGVGPLIQVFLPRLDVKGYPRRGSRHAV